ncbi:MAG: PDDEXK nuclease domain-containing protein [Bacteroidales bacterium]|nr:PDDEXK nuclease domain-containing protein [Bacteroidales bacterium]
MKEIESNIIGSLVFKDVCQLIEQTKSGLARVVNSELTMLYWHIGGRINREILQNKRAEYGKQIVSQLATLLTQNYGKEFEVRNLRRMIQFSVLFPNVEKVSQAATKLSWSHFIELLTIKDDLQREFYLWMSIHEGWGRDTLRKQITSMLFERTAISGKPEDFIKKELSDLSENNKISPELVFKSPYFLNFTGLKGYFSEKTLEDILIGELERFILELGSGFSFVERQKRMIIDGEDFYLDLLFYHRKLKRLIAIELKITKFKAAYKGQMELYLEWLNKYERQDGEESPLGLILCTNGGTEQIELLKLDEAGIKVAQYYTELPDKKLLEEQLRKSIEVAKMRMSEKK